jgi:excisionase family DNA binding protein
MTHRGLVEAKAHHHRDAAIRSRRNGENQMRFFTISDVAESLRVSMRTVRRWIDTGQLVAHRFKGVLRIADGDLRAFLAEHREG